MQERAKTITGWAATGGPLLYWGFVKLDTLVGHLTFWDNVKEKALPLWRDEIAPMLTVNNLATLCFAGGIATLVWMHFGHWLTMRVRGAIGLPDVTTSESQQTSHPEATPAGPTVASIAAAPIPTQADDPKDKHQLVVFVADFLIPACNAQDDFQYETVNSLIKSHDLRRIAS